MSAKTLASVEESYRRGDFFSAERVLREFLIDKKCSEHPSLYVLLGAVLGKQRKFSEALAPLQEALGYDPSLLEGFNWLSVCLRHLGRLGEAETSCLSALALNPKDADSNFNLGLCYIAERQFAEAIVCLLKALEAQRKNPQILQNLGLAYQGLNDDGRAIECYRRAIQIAPNASPCHVSLGTLLLKQSNGIGALKCAMQALEFSPDALAGHMLAARAYTLLNKMSDSKRHLAVITDLDPQHSMALAMLGFRDQFEGDFESAKKSFEKSIKVKPRQGIAYWGIYQAKNGRTVEPHDISGLEELSKDATIGVADRSYLYYCLGKIFEDRGEPGLAMQNLDRANSLAAEAAFGDKKFDREGRSLGLKKTKSIFNKDFICENRSAGNSSSRPLFIVGMIRSGTTLMEQILSSHPQVAGGGEMVFWLERGPACIDISSNTLIQQKATSLVADYLEQLRTISVDGLRVTDKMPDNLQMVGLINILFPNAKVVNMNRNPIDNCLSIYSTPFEFPPSYAHDRENIAFAYRENQALTEHWREVLPEGVMIDVSYEALTSNPEPVVREVLSHCGLEWDEKCLSPEKNQRTVSTPSVWQVRQPIYRTSTAKWKRYQGLTPEFDGLINQ